MKLILQQKQTMNLVMTTELRQAIELLQYSTYDLLQYIREQEEENPFIELIEKDNDNFTMNYSGRKSYNRSSDSEEVDPLDFVSNDDEDIYDYILGQLNWLKIDEEEKVLIEYLILNLNENGYLEMTNEEIKAELNIDDKTLERMITILQSFEPVGIGGRDLAECLLIQAKHYYPDNESVHQIIEDHLEDLANRKWEHICKSLNISLK